MPFSLTLTERLHIAAPPAEVWAVFSRLQEWPGWNPVCVALRDISADPAPWAVGARFTLVLRMAGVPVPFPVTVTESSPPHAVTWSSTHFGITGTRTISFVPEGDGTLASDRKVFTSPMLPVALFYPRPIIHQMANASLRALKRCVEAG
jgi:hypothetical protein